VIGNVEFTARDKQNDIVTTERCFVDVAVADVAVASDKLRPEH
jgi:hypothetical protein